MHFSDLPSSLRIITPLSNDWRFGTADHAIGGWPEH
jgi:hypothetical protein